MNKKFTKLYPTLECPTVRKTKMYFSGQEKLGSLHFFLKKKNNRKILEFELSSEKGERTSGSINHLKNVKLSFYHSESHEFAQNFHRREKKSRWKSENLDSGISKIIAYSKFNNLVYEFPWKTFSSVYFLPKFNFSSSSTTFSYSGGTVIKLSFIRHI